MRPKLKSDTFYLPLQEGVYLRNNEKAFVMKGKALGSWIERLAPVLDGQYDLEELCQRMPPEKSSMIIKIVDILAEQGYVKDISGDQPHTLSAHLAETYASAITFIDHHTDSGAYRFQRFLTWPILAIGSGDALVALGHALLETGNQRIALLDSNEERTDHARLHDILTLLQESRDRELSLTTIALAQWQDDALLQDVMAAYPMVLYFSTSGDLAQVGRLTELAQHVGASFLPAYVVDNEIHIGPTHHPHTQGCWQCYWRRIQAAHGLPAADEQGRLLYTASQKLVVDLGAPAIAIAANKLAFECFKQGTSATSETLEKQVDVLGLERLQCVMHRLFPHPLCTICATPPSASAAGDLAAFEQRATSLTVREILRQSDLWADASCGIFTSIDEHDYFQLPLVRSRIQVAIVPSTEKALPIVKVAGLDYDEVRILALQQAGASYLDSLTDPRRVHANSYAQLSAHQMLPHPRQYAGWLGQDVSEQSILAWLTAYWLDTGRPVPVPAAAAYPTSSWNQDAGTTLFTADLPGLGIGLNWHEALAHGLQSLAAHLDASQDAIAAARLAPSAYADDQICRAYGTMLEILQGDVVLVDHTASSQVPHLDAYLNGHLLAHSEHWDAQEAAREALKSAVLHLQIERSPSPDDDPSLLSRENQTLLEDLPVRYTLPASLAGSRDYPAAIQALQACFRQHGWRFIVVPIGVDATVAQILPGAVRVLAIQQGEERS